MMVVVPADPLNTDDDDDVDDDVVVVVTYVVVVVVVGCTCVSTRASSASGGTCERVVDG